MKSGLGSLIYHVEGILLTSSTPASSMSMWNSMSDAAMRTPAMASPSPFHVVQKPVICSGPHK